MSKESCSSRAASARGACDAPTLRLKLAMQILWSVEKEFAMMSVRRSVAHRSKLEKNNERKEPRTFGPLDLSIAPRTEGTTVQMCGESNVAGNWINGQYAMGKIQEANWSYSEDAALVVEDVESPPCENDRRRCEAHFQGALPGG